MRVLLTAVVLVPFVATAAEAPAEWAAHRGGPGATGISPDASIKPPLRMVWSYRCDGDTTGDAGSGPTVAGGKVFCNLAMSRMILALDAETGRFCREYAHRDVHYQQTSTFADRRLFVWLRGYGRSTIAAQRVDWFFALDAATGRVKWKDCVPISIERLQLHDGRLYLRSARQIAEYDPATGKRLRLANAVYSYNGLAFFGPYVVTTGAEGTSAVDLSQPGQPNRHPDQPALAGVLVLGNLSVPDSPRVASQGTPVVAGDLIAFASTAGEVVLKRPLVDRRTERLLPWENVWSTKLGGTCHSSPIVADGRLLVGCDDGRLYAFRSAIRTTP